MNNAIQYLFYTYLTSPIQNRRILTFGCFEISDEKDVNMNLLLYMTSRGKVIKITISKFLLDDFGRLQIWRYL